MDNMEDNIEVKYNIKYTNKYSKNDDPIVKVVVYGFEDVFNEHHFKDNSDNVWAIIDNTIIKFDKGVIFNAVAYRRNKRIA